MSFIDIHGIDKRFGAFQALAGVDLTVEEREFITLLGPSGCGKTTMLRVLAGFLVPDSGTVNVGGRMFSSAKAVLPPEQRRMGMVFQNYAVWPHMSVFDNVAFGLRIAKIGRGEIAERVARVLAAVGLEGLERRHPGQLSPARWWWSRRSCCWTSHSLTWTPSCASACVQSSRRCNGAWASRSST